MGGRRRVEQGATKAGRQKCGADSHHGLRVTEVLQLRLADSINWKDRTITVRRLKGSLTTTQPLVDVRGKPALNEVAAIKAYLRVRIDDGSGNLFTGQKGALRRWTLAACFVAIASKYQNLAPLAAWHRSRKTRCIFIRSSTPLPQSLPLEWITFFSLRRSWAMRLFPARCVTAIPILSWLRSSPKEVLMQTFAAR